MMADLMSIRKLCFFGVLLASCAPVVFCLSHKKRPDWTDKTKRDHQYPATQFLRGYAIGNKNKSETVDLFLERLAVLARKELLESVHVQVDDHSVVRTGEDNGKFYTSFRVYAQTHSTLQLPNLTLAKYYDHATQIGYVFAYVRRADLQALYERKIAPLFEQAEKYLSAARQDTAQHCFIPALRKAFAVFALLRQTQVVLPVLVALGMRLSESQHDQLNADARTLIETVIQQLQPTLAALGQTEYTVMLGQKPEQPLRLRLDMNPEVAGRPLTDVPIRFFMGQNTLCTLRTDTNGLVHCVLPRWFHARSLHVVNAVIDLVQWFGAEETDLQRVNLAALRVPVRFVFRVAPVKLFVQSADPHTRFVQGLNAFLTNLDFILTTEPQQADYILSVQETLYYPQPNTPPIFFAYAGADIRLRTHSGETLFHEQFADQKGAGIDQTQAAANALQLLLEHITVFLFR